MPISWIEKVLAGSKMKYLQVTLVFLFVAHIGKAEEVATGKTAPAGEELDKRVLLQDDYYTIVNKLNELTAEVAELKRHQVTNRVAFKAHLATPMSPAKDQLIVFDDVRFNMGKAYHHGTFIAPYNGTYLFSVTICSNTGHYIVVDLLQNGNMIGQVLAGDVDYAACSSETTVTELAAGDDVIVQHRGNVGDYIYGDINVHNSFTGVLLF